jgi:UDP-glucuronate 4-epimerase
MQRVLVTGCAGFLGSHLSERLLELGYEVVGIDCFTANYGAPRKFRNLERLLEEPRFRLARIDLAVDPLGELLEGVEDVFHLAGQSGVRGSFGTGFGAYVRHNVQVTQRLLEQVAERPLRAFVYASSSAVYGHADRSAVESMALRPVSPYGMSKVAAESLAGVYWRTRGVPVVGLRYFTVYGPRQRPDMAFSRFLRRALAGEPLQILGDGRQCREFTYAEDVIEATVAAAARGRRGAVYNIAGGASVPVLDVVGLLEALLDRRLAVEHLPSALGDARNTRADTSAAAAELGFAARTALSDGLAAQLEWSIAEPSGAARVAA